MQRQELQLFQFSREKPSVAWIVHQTTMTVLKETKVLASLKLPENVYVNHSAFLVMQQGLPLTRRSTHATPAGSVSFVASTMT